MTRTRLQLPFGVTNYGPLKSVTYPGEYVNTYSTQNLEKDANEKTEMQLALEKAGIEGETEKANLCYGIFLTPIRKNYII